MYVYWALAGPEKNNNTPHIYYTVLRFHAAYKSHNKTTSASEHLGCGTVQYFKNIVKDTECRIYAEVPSMD